MRRAAVGGALVVVFRLQSVAAAIRVQVALARRVPIGAIRVKS
jgi:hypothetical protein